MATMTLCVRGLPVDCTRREFRCLVGLLPDYEDSSLSSGAMGFVKFSSAEAAADAQVKLSGFIFDQELEPDRQLSVEYAKRELEYRPPRPQQSRPSAHPHYNGVPAMPHQTVHAPVQQQMVPMMHPSIMYERYPQSTSGYPQAQHKRPRVENDPEPGGSKDTLCIRRIPIGTPQEVIERLVFEMRGFKSLNLANSGANAVAFVQFERNDQARDALDDLQRAEVTDAHGNRQELSVEYARRSSRPLQARQ
eukprot:CAMPEP_0119313188 /NCGR_PEP_ID=MMETSP1333-20130426/28169_1 /TAXON_ID=418940 /ORGANISM="Scyphosphaera apsteinii, Strain RCC1455" /LENGTH=248 /DNA_ID=CAMNT_0007317963 /DNA_START=23 /DNA_END=769 /DNA_ORIENTATION=-